MSEEIKNDTAELSDTALGTVTGGITINGKKIPDGYVYCVQHADGVFCNHMCKLHGTSDCIEFCCNPSAAKQ